MKVNIDHSSVKRNVMIYYVTVNVQFSEEEKAVIRARNLGDDVLTFQTGLLNMPPQAFTNAPLVVIQVASRLMAFFGILFFFFVEFIGPWPFLICLIGAPALFFYRKHIERAQKNLDKQELKVKDIVAAPFTLCTHTLAYVPDIEQEVTDKLRTVKDLIVRVTEAPKAKTVEI